ncbi:MAG: hypothetical protein WCY88_04730 [Spongiibacteraceae bacterium]
MIESSESEHADDKTKHEPADQVEPLQIWADWLRDIATIGADTLQLLQLEVRLAIKDSKRLLVLALLFVPVLMLTWLGLAVLLAWLVYLLDSSVTQGLLAFLIIHVAALIGIVVGWRHYRKSLSLPLSRQHIRQLMGGQDHDT